MTKKLLSVALISTALLFKASLPVFAGGYLTNTNHSISYLRMPAQNAVISVNSAYFNPAGVGFLDNGWHLSFGIQNIHQKRKITSTYAPFKYGINNNGLDTKKFEGLTNVPILPSFDLAYVHDRWFGSLHFGAFGGGGKADFKNGLGSFEGQIALLHAAANMLHAVAIQKLTGSSPEKPAFNGYNADINLLGEQYYLGGQLNIGYKINENLSVSAGARLTYVTSTNKGSLSNIVFREGNYIIPANEGLKGVVKNLKKASKLKPGLSGIITPEILEGVNQKIDALMSNKSLECTQHDWTIAPIIGIDYKTGNFNFAARYEFKTVVNLQNDTKKNDIGLPQYADGERFRNDVPALLSLGTQYTPMEELRLNLGFNYYFDKQCKQFNSLTNKNDKQENLKTNPYEILFGVEYDINNKFTVSSGVQRTIFGFGKNGDYISDMNFSVSSWSYGLGARFNLNDKISFDIAMFHTIYDKYTKNMDDYNGIASGLAKKALNKIESISTEKPGLASQILPNLKPMLEGYKIPGKDVYHRNSIDLGFGINYSF